MKRKTLFALCGLLLLVASCSTKEDLTEFRKELSDLRTLFDPIDTRVLKLEEQAARVDKSIEALEKTGNQLSQYVSDLQTETNRLDAGVTELGRSMQETIDTVKGNIRTEMKNIQDGIEGTLALIQTDLANLHGKDEQIQKMVSDLKAYVEGDLKNYIDSQDEAIVAWTNGTFATLEQYRDAVKAIESLEVDIKDANDRITKLDTDLRNKIDTDVAQLKQEASSDIQQKMTELTEGYKKLISETRENITKAYEKRIAESMESLDLSIKSWVCDTLSYYYTSAQIDAKCAALQTLTDENFRLYGIAFDQYRQDMATAEAEITAAYKQYITSACANGGEVDVEIKRQVAALQQEKEAQLDRIQEKVDAVGKRITTLEPKVKTLEDQSAAILRSIDTLQNVDAALRGYIDRINTIIGEVPSPYGSTIMEDIAALMAKDVDLETKINELKAYVDGELKSYIDKQDADLKDWAEESLKSYYKSTEVDDLLSVIRQDISSTNDKLAIVRDSLKILDSKINEITREGGMIDATLSGVISDLQQWVSTGYFTKQEFGGKIDSLANAIDIRLGQTSDELAALTASIDTVKANIRAELDAQKQYLLDSLQKVKDNAVDSIAKMRAEALETIVRNEAYALDSIANAKTEVLDSVARAKAEVLEQLKADKASIEEKLDKTADAVREAYGIAIQDAVDTKGGELSQNLVDSVTTVRGGYTGTLMTLKREIDAIDTRVGQLETSVGQLKTDVSTMQDDMADLTSRMQQAEADIDQIFSDIADLQQADIDIKASIDNLETALKDKIQADSLVIRGMINDLQQSDTDINNTLGGIESTLSGIHITVDGINETLGTLATVDSVRNVAASLALLTERVAQNELDISELQPRVVDLENLTQEISGRLDALEGMVQSVVFLGEKCYLPYKFNYNSDKYRYERLAVSSTVSLQYLVNTNNDTIDVNFARYDITAEIIQTITRAAGDTKTLTLRRDQKSYDKATGILTLTLDCEDIVSADDRFFYSRSGEASGLNMSITISDKSEFDKHPDWNRNGYTNISTKYIPFATYTDDVLDFYLSDYVIYFDADDTTPKTVNIFSGKKDKAWTVNPVYGFNSYFTLSDIQAENTNYTDLDWEKVLTEEDYNTIWGEYEKMGPIERLLYFIPCCIESIRCIIDKASDSINYVQFFGDGSFSVAPKSANTSGTERTATLRLSRSDLPGQELRVTVIQRAAN